METNDKKKGRPVLWSRAIFFLRRNQFVYGFLLALSFLIAFFGFVNPLLFAIGLPLFAFLMFMGYHMVNQVEKPTIE